MLFSAITTNLNCEILTKNLVTFERWDGVEKSIIIIIVIIIIIIIITVIELTHSTTILENTVEIEPQPAALDFKNLSQYSSCSK